MLILRCLLDGSIMIGEGDQLVTIKVVELRRNSVRLGITAPASVKVDRESTRLAQQVDLAAPDGAGGPA